MRKADFFMKENVSMTFDVPVRGEYDVIVAGGGPAGCTAAIASAREGKRTLLIEATTALGGMGTMGLVPTWCPFSDKKKMIYRGLAGEIFVKSRACVPSVSAGRLDWVPINAEELKRIYDEMVTESGAIVLFQTNLCGVRAENGKAEAILVSNKQGLSLYKAKVFIDCTGDADLALGAGAECEKGNAKGTVQPSTHCFILANVDTYAYEHQVNDLMHRRDTSDQSMSYLLMKDPELDLIVDTHFCNSLLAPGTVGFNAGHIFNLDSTDPMAVSEALLKGRRIAEQFLRGLKKYAPEAFANAYIAQTGTLMGIRESRRVVCDYRLTANDYVNRQSFDDEIGRNSYYIDIHNSIDELDKVKDGTFSPSRFERYGEGESHGIPYRCLTPVGLSNVLVAGRCIGSDSAMNGSIRVMPPCLVTGEAAGIAAAMACDMGTPDIHAVDVSALQENLLRHGAYLHIDQE